MPQPSSGPLQGEIREKWSGDWPGIDEWVARAFGLSSSEPDGRKLASIKITTTGDAGPVLVEDVICNVTAYTGHFRVASALVKALEESTNPSPGFTFRAYYYKPGISDADMIFGEDGDTLPTEEIRVVSAIHRSFIRVDARPTPTETGHVQVQRISPGGEVSTISTLIKEAAAGSGVRLSGETAMLVAILGGTIDKLFAFNTFLLNENSAQHADMASVFRESLKGREREVSSLRSGLERVQGDLFHVARSRDQDASKAELERVKLSERLRSEEERRKSVEGNLTAVRGDVDAHRRLVLQKEKDLEDAKRAVEEARATAAEAKQGEGKIRDRFEGRVGDLMDVVLAKVGKTVTGDGKGGNPIEMLGSLSAEELAVALRMVDPAKLRAAGRQVVQADQGLARDMMVEMADEYRDKYEVPEDTTNGDGSTT